MPNSFRHKVVEEGLDDPMTDIEREFVSQNRDALAAEHQDESQADTEHEGENGPESNERKRRRYHMPRLNATIFFKSLSWLLLLLLYGFIVVTNRYKVESLSKEKIRISNDIDYLKEQRIQMQRDYQESIRISRIAAELDTIGVGLISGPPYEIQNIDQGK